MCDDCQDLDMLHKNESDDNQDTIETLQSSLQDEIQKRQNAEEDMKRYIQVGTFEWIKLSLQLLSGNGTSWVLLDTDRRRFDGIALWYIIL